ncbi:amylovoran biosynthesis protein AmsF [Erwinia endophytica]|uniref:phage tailspike protein n=1 Tax=Erwinia endophytica TaxID=1563158 RepID=UPI001265DE9E|nr:phage tailspike protein [Erwinia endophytica]KAB8307351.1 amylovoran biosynthesis protein AmsF [Erwinia endophytica]
MKRRELITGFSSILAALSVSSFSSQAAKKDASVSMTDVNAGDIPKDDVPILTPENIYAMPERFWENFSGKLYIGKAGTDPTQAGNLIDVFLRNADGKLSKIAQPVALNRGNFQTFIADNAALIANPVHSMAVLDDNGHVLFNIPDISRLAANNFSQRLVQPAGYQLIGEISSVNELRKTRPLFEGAKVKLSSWHEGREQGGGEFVGSFSPATDDGGVTFAGAGFHWRRVVQDFNRLTLFDFGAIDDGKTDTAPAVRAMYNWSRKADQPICVQFPAGTFLVSGCDFSQEETRFFRVSGAMVNFGYFPATTIVSDGKSDFVFEVNSRWVEIGNLIFNGRADHHPNEQGFFNNKCPGGQYFRGACLYFKAVGGTSLSLMDTLDCKIDQWYASKCTGDVIKSVWSGQKTGKWDHSTAIELSNFNAQHCSKGMVLNLDRCSQSIIHNGWIEHSENPGNISNGQWIIDALSIETCKNPLIAHNSRLNMRQTNLQAGSWIDNSRAEGAWLSAFEQGSTRVESYGIAVDGSMKYNYLLSRFRLVNNSNQEKWIELGNIFTPEVGDSWEIEIIGQAGFSNGTDQQTLEKVVGGAATGGKAMINLQRKTHKFEANWHAEGASPIVDVMIETPYDTDARVYVKLAGWLASAGVLMKSTAKDRFMTGACARFDSKMAEVKQPAGANVHRAVQRFTLHNGKAGIGANEQGDVLMQSRVLNADEVDISKAAGYVSMVINGQQVAVPYFAIKK